MFCPNCGEPLDDNTKECPVCGCHIENADSGTHSGQKSSLKCPVCGFALYAEDRVCPLCGASIGTRMEEEPEPSAGGGAEQSPEKGGRVDTSQELKRKKQQEKERQEKQKEKEAKEEQERQKAKEEQERQKAKEEQERQKAKEEKERQKAKEEQERQKAKEEQEKQKEIEQQKEQEKQKEIERQEELEKQREKERQEKQKEEKRDSRPRRRAWIIILIIIIVVVVVILVLFFTGVIGSGERRADRSTMETTAVEEGEGSANVAPNTSYIGYWNISGSEEEELTISSVTDSTVGFSLWWRNLFRVDNATAFINDENIATFSCEDSGMKMSGNLTFYEDYIIVQITESNIDYVQTGTMVFNEKHLEAWSDTESASASSSSSSSSDSSSTSSSSTSNQNSSTASSGSNSNSSSYYYNGDYVLPNSSSELLTYADIQGLTSDELRLARNEIYARHGRKFDDNALQSYFNSKPWYSGTIDPDDFSQDMLSSIERSNISFIESYE